MTVRALGGSMVVVVIAAASGQTDQPYSRCSYRPSDGRPYPLPCDAVGRARGFGRRSRVVDSGRGGD